MKTQINAYLKHVGEGALPYCYRLSWPVNPDDNYVYLYIMWEMDEEWECHALTIVLDWD